MKKPIKLEDFADPKETIGKTFRTFDGEKTYVILGFRQRNNKKYLVVDSDNSVYWMFYERMNSERRAKDTLICPLIDYIEKQDQSGQAA